MKKICSSCKTEKLFSEFFARKSSKDGLQNQCKPCKSEAVKQWRAVNPEAVKEHNALSYVRNTEAVKASVRRWKSANPQRARELDRAKEARNPERKTARNAKRKAALLNAIPSWVDMNAVKGMYQLAGVFRRIGLDMEVDHIVPLQGETVTGLHTHHNLQLMLGSKNTSKGNRAWPDMP
jgi:5-methylcytosine-specific restriction endonuclease McrA